MKLIVGLGNPGKEYHLTRHNVGFMVLKEIAQLNDLKFRANKRFNALTAEGLIGEENCYLSMPQTFMNLSGNSVRSITRWLKVDVDNVLLIVDDIALPFGSIRIKAKGSDAGHKGVASVIDYLGTNEFSRMRVGILGRKNIRDLSNYVLNRFSKKEQKELPDILSLSYSACECWVKEGVDAAMNRYNSKTGC